MFAEHGSMTTEKVIMAGVPWLHGAGGVSVRGCLGSSELKEEV